MTGSKRCVSRPVDTGIDYTTNPKIVNRSLVHHFDHFIDVTSVSESVTLVTISMCY